MESVALPGISPISVAVLFGIMQLVLIIYFLHAKKYFRNNIYLILFVIVLIIALLESFLIRSGTIFNFLSFVNFSTPFIFLLGPLLYQYTLNLLGDKIPIKKMALHAIPFIFYFFYSFHFFLQPNEFKYNAIVRSFYPELPLETFLKTFSEDPWNIRGWVVVEILTLHLMIYSTLSFYKIFQKKHIAFRNKDRSKYTWSVFLNLILFLSALILYFSQGGVINGRVFMKSPFPHYFPDLGAIVFSYLITTYLVTHPQIVSYPANKYSKSSISDSYKSKKVQELKRIIESEKLYLSNKFSLDLLAQKSGLSKHHISQILNEKLNATFFELTNNYRVEEAKKRLALNKFIKIEQLAYDLGYNSKSTFFKAFKKKTSLTPLEFRRKRVS